MKIEKERILKGVQLNKGVGIAFWRNFGSFFCPFSIADSPRYRCTSLFRSNYFANKKGDLKEAYYRYSILELSKFK
jgi:hypothetical protein